MKKRSLRVILTFFWILLSVAAAWAATPVVTVPTYRFDDIYGPSGSGAQWVAITDAGGTVGAATRFTMETTANFVNSRDHVYILGGNLTTPPAVDAIFLVLPGSASSMTVAFDWMAPIPAGASYTQDVLTDFYAYQVVKDPLSTTSGARKLWQFGFTKVASTNAYDTKRGNMIFQQNPDNTPSQTLQIPMIVANVCNNTAEGNPLLFRSTMRETYSGAKSGNIVAYDRFTWNVVGDLAVGGSNSDWVFVPVKQFPIDSNVVNYLLSTEITNYCGIRYALQRYDGVGNTTLMLPSKWTMDLPADVKDVNPNIVLDELSHIPPGLITTYNQNFNVVSGVQSIFDMYPIDPTGGHRRLELSHPSIFGLDLGTGSGSDYAVTGFQLLASDTNFLKNVASAMDVKGAAMPEASDSVMSGAVSQSYVAGDAVNTIAVEAKVPAKLVTSGDTAGLLPLHITMNLPHSNRFVAPKWNSFLSEWKETGNIKRTFANNFSLYTHDAEGKNIDLFKWLESKNTFDRTIKVFMDEDKDCITVSFIVMLMDGKERTMAMVQDKTVTTDNSYLVMKDGNLNDKWDMTFFTAPMNYVPSDPPASGGSGGGCNTGIPVLGLFFACGFAAIRLWKGERK